MENYKDFTTRELEITPEDIEQFQADLAADKIRHDAWIIEQRTKAGMKMAGVNAGEWEEIHPMLKGMYIEMGVDAHNYAVDNAPRLGGEEYSVYI